MKYCTYCGSELEDNADVCIYCGRSVVGLNNENQTIRVDESSFGFCVIGFCFPFLGILIWLLYKRDTPIRAKSGLNGALISIILGIISYLLLFYLGYY